MTHTVLILRFLVIRPMPLNDIKRATGLRQSDAKACLETLEGAGRVWRDDAKLWHFGADPLYKGPVHRDYCVQRDAIAPGYVVVRFGDRWRAGHGQRPPATPGRANALGNIYA